MKSHRRGLIATTLLIAVVISVLAVMLSRRSRQHSVVLIVVDTLRQDHLALYGYERETAPFLSRLGSQGAVFDGLSSSSWTKPATASLLTGLHPIRHQTVGRTDALPTEVRTLPEILTSYGYQANGISANGHITGEFGFAQGFRRLLYLRAMDDTNSRAMQVNAVLIPALKNLRPPFFLYVHYIDPHSPYAPLSSWDGSPLSESLRAHSGGLTVEQLLPSVVARRDSQSLRDAIDLYDGEIRQVDVAIEHLMHALRVNGALENTLVIVTADHGEEFEEHGMLSHGQSLYEEVTRVPLIVYSPKLVRPGRRRGVAQLEDVVPTVLAILGIEERSADGSRFDGLDLSRVLRSREEAIQPRDHLLHLDYIEPTPTNEGIYRGELALLRDETRTKAILGHSPSRKELFDLALDRGESRNLLSSEMSNPVATNAFGRIRDLYNELSKRALTRRRADANEATLKDLQALGYVAGLRQDREPRVIPRRIEQASPDADGILGWEEGRLQSCVLPASAAAEHQLLKGWHHSDGIGRWTEGTRASVVLRAPRSHRSVLTLEGDSRNPRPVRLSTTIGTSIATEVLLKPLAPFQIEIPVVHKPGDTVLVRLQIDQAFHPSVAFGSDDIRELGILLRTICLNPEA